MVSKSVCNWRVCHAEKQKLNGQYFLGRFRWHYQCNGKASKEKQQAMTHQKAAAFAESIVNHLELCTKEKNHQENLIGRANKLGSPS